MTIISPHAAAQAYMQHAKGVPASISPPAGAKPISQPNGQNSSDIGFVEFIKSSTSDAIKANTRAETLAQEALAGRASLTEAITAIAHAETTLRTVVTIRDKAISAYQEIKRMPI